MAHGSLRRTLDSSECSEILVGVPQQRTLRREVRLVIWEVSALRWRRLSAFSPGGGSRYTGHFVQSETRSDPRKCRIYAFAPSRQLATEGFS